MCILNEFVTDIVHSVFWIIGIFNIQKEVKIKCYLLVIMMMMVISAKIVDGENIMNVTREVDITITIVLNRNEADALKKFLGAFSDTGINEKFHDLESNKLKTIRQVTADIYNELDHALDLTPKDD